MITGAILALAGIMVIVFRKTIIKDRAALEKYHLGIKYTTFDNRYGEALGIIVGLLLITAGVCLLFGLIKIR